MKTFTLALLFFLFSPVFLLAQQNLAEKLGYPADAKLLIVHADDIGLAQSANAATIKAFEEGGITSGSIMVPCPWFEDFAAYYQEHPGLDVGIHITLTAEWDHYKWGGVLPATEIPSLLDQNGHFYASVQEVAKNAIAEEAEKEIRAQIERAMSFGINPTHLDTHMASVAATPELMEIYMKLGMEYGIPVFIPRLMLMGVPEETREMIKQNYVLVDKFYMLNTEGPDASWEELYGEMISGSVPGLNVMIVHLAHDNAEMQAVAVNHPAFGSTWRQQDLDYVLSQNFRDELKKHQIYLVGWEDIQNSL